MTAKATKALVELAKVSNDTAPPEETVIRSRLVRADSAWLSETPPAREYLLEDTRTGLGAMTARGTSLLVSAGGVGKSFASCALAISVATGTHWLGQFRVVRPGRVLMVSAEEPKDELRRRLFYVARAVGVSAFAEHHIDILDLHGIAAPFVDPVAMTPTVHALAIQKVASEGAPYALTIVDTLTKIAGASIDGDNVAAAALITALDGLGTATAGATLGVHHTSGAARKMGTADATAVRGATALGDNARLVMMLTKETVAHEDADERAHLGEIVTLRDVKRNYAMEWAPVELRRGPHGELLPLDAPDRAAVEHARHLGGNKQRAREDERRRALDLDDEAARQALRDHPGATVRDLMAFVCRARSCGHTRAHSAVKRVKGDAQ